MLVCLYACVLVLLCLSACVCARLCMCVCLYVCVLVGRGDVGVYLRLYLFCRLLLYYAFLSLLLSLKTYVMVIVLWLNMFLSFNTISVCVLQVDII